MPIWLRNPRPRMKIFLSKEEADREVRYNFVDDPVELYRGILQTSASAARNYIANNVPGANAGIVVREYSNTMHAYTWRFTLYPINVTGPARRQRQ